MKLLNYTTLYFSLILVVIIPIWAGLFYFSMLEEIYDSMDDGLDNQRMLIITKAAQDSTVLTKHSFEEGNYSISQISKEQARGYKDVFLDTLMYMENEKDFEPVRLLKTVFINNGNCYSMQVITSMVEEDDLILDLTYSLLWLYFGLIITIIFLNNSLLRNIWKPFNILMNQLKTFNINQSQPLKLSKTRITEFNTLQNAVQRFLSNSVQTYNQQKQFIENASHELQTPVAITINKLELLAESSRLSAYDSELLSSALNNLERLKRLNQSLLLLSKIENQQFAENTKVNINETCKRISENFTDQIDFCNLQFSLKEDGICTWKMNADLAYILISNVIKNAIKHSPRGGNINILITERTFRIENTGDSALDEKIIFQRFQKNGKSNDSTGLGLAIVKAIASISDLSLEYTYQNKHIFTISEMKTI